MDGLDRDASPFLKIRVEIMEDKYVVVDNLRVRFKAYISKETPITLFLHGYSFTADTWDEIGTLSFMKRNERSFYAIDMPGFGKSEGKRIKDGFVAADFLKKVLETLNIDKPIIVGPSMGGRYALSFAIKYPKNVSGLVLIAPAGLNDEKIKTGLSRIDVPVLIFWGDKDRVFPVEMGYVLKEKLKNSKLVICKGAPHPCYLKATDTFNKELLEFVKSL